MGMIDAYCPRCGARMDLAVADWDDSVRATRLPGPVPDAQYVISGFTCSACGADSPPTAWHRARERRLLRERGFVTPRMLREEPISA